MYVAVRVKGQRLYNASSRVFESERSANQIISRSDSRPIRFVQARSSANHTISLPSSCPIKFFEVGSSVNQMISRSSSRPIRFSGAKKFSELGDFVLRLSSNLVLRGWGNRIHRQFLKICNFQNFIAGCLFEEWHDSL